MFPRKLCKTNGLPKTLPKVNMLIYDIYDNDDTSTTFQQIITYDTIL